MTQKAILAGVVPIVSFIPPIRITCASVEKNISVRNLNTQYAVITRSYAIPFVDNYSPFHKKGGNVLFEDCVHLNNHGYEVIAEQFFNAILTNNILYK